MNDERCVYPLLFDETGPCAWIARSSVACRHYPSSHVETTHPLTGPVECLGCSGQAGGGLPRRDGGDAFHAYQPPAAVVCGAIREIHGESLGMVNGHPFTPEPPVAVPTERPVLPTQVQRIREAPEPLVEEGLL